MSVDFLTNANFSEHVISVLATYDSNSITSGSLLTSGGLGVKLSAHIGEELYVNSVNVTPSLGDIISEREQVLVNNSSGIIDDMVFYNDITQSFDSIISVEVTNNLQPELNKRALWNISGSLGKDGWMINKRFTGDIINIIFSINNTIINSRNAGQLHYNNTYLSGTTIIRYKANTVSPSGASNNAGSYAATPAEFTANMLTYTSVNTDDWKVVPTNGQEALDELADRITNIRFEYEYYVSKDGDDSTGNGSLEKPYLTITAALNVVNNEADNVPVVINISPGQYNEILTIIKPNICLKGSTIGSTKTSRINGRITINPRSSSGGVYANYYTFENLSIVSGSTHVIGYTGSHTGYLYLNDCMLYTSTAGVKGMAFTNTTSAKVNINKCDINITGNGNSNCIYTEAGSAITGSFYNCNIYGKVAPTISIDGSSNIAFNYSYIENTGSDVIELKNSVVAFFSYCTIANYELNSNGFNISSGTSLILSHSIFNIPTNVTYNPFNPGSPPATTTGYAVKGPGGIGSNIIYGSCLFTPVSLVGASYYWGTKAISNTVNVVQYNTTFSSQA